MKNIETTSNAETTEISTGFEANVALVGVEAEIVLSIEPESKENEKE